MTELCHGMGQSDEPEESGIEKLKIVRGGMEETREALLAQLDKVRSRVKSLKEGCCTPTRHCMFDDLMRYSDDLKRSVGEGEPHPMTGEEQKRVVRFGQVLRTLAVTCCIPERIPQYSECVTMLNAILFSSLAPAEEPPQEEKH